MLSIMLTIAVLAIAGLAAALARRGMCRAWSPLLWAAALAVYAFLYIPLVVVVIFSFDDGGLSAEWVGFTTDWYRKLFEDEEMLAAAVDSLIVAFVAAGLATVLGTMAGIAMHRYRSRSCRMVLTPIAMPEILLGVALLIFLIDVRRREPVARHRDRRPHDVLHRLRGDHRARATRRHGRVDLRGGADLGATPWQTFRLVTLPLIKPGIIAGALIAFARRSTTS